MHIRWITEPKATKSKIPRPQMRVAIYKSRDKEVLDVFINQEAYDLIGKPGKCQMGLSEEGPVVAPHPRGLTVIKTGKDIYRIRTTRDIDLLRPHVCDWQEVHLVDGMLVARGA